MYIGGAKRKGQITYTHPFVSVQLHTPGDKGSEG